MFVQRAGGPRAEIWSGLDLRYGNLRYQVIFSNNLEVFTMEFTPIAPIRPLFDTTEAQPGQSVESTGASMFANVFQSAIDNVRQTNATQVDLEYKLATGQIDNPAEVTLAASKASTAAILLMEMRNKAVDTYNEIMRISL